MVRRDKREDDLREHYNQTMDYFENLGSTFVVTTLGQLLYKDIGVFRDGVDLETRKRIVDSKIPFFEALEEWESRYYSKEDCKLLCALVDISILKEAILKQHPWQSHERDILIEHLQRRLRGE